MSEHVDTALLILCLTALLSNYVWTFLQIQKVKEMIHEHTSKSGVHTDSKELVFKDVCSIQVKAVLDKISGVKEDVEEIKSIVRDIHKRGANSDA